MKAIDTIRRQYLQLVDPPHIGFPPLTLLRQPLFQSKLYTALFESSNPHPPPDRYKARVLKRLITLLSEPSVCIFHVFFLDQI